MNIQLDQVAPWQLMKNPENQPRIDSFIYILLDCLRILFELAYPVIPRTSARALQNMGCSKITAGEQVHQFQSDRLTQDYQVGTDTTLFPRIKI